MILRNQTTDAAPNNALVKLRYRINTRNPFILRDEIERRMGLGCSSLSLQPMPIALVLPTGAATHPHYLDAHRAQTPSIL